MKTKKKGYKPLILLTILLTLSAVNTLIPAAEASKPSFLGYKAHCSFTPISTILCLLGAGAVCMIRSRKFTED